MILKKSFGGSSPSLFAQGEIELKPYQGHHAGWEKRQLNSNVFSNTSLSFFSTNVSFSMEENYHLHDQIYFGVSCLEIKTKTNVFKSFYLTLSGPCFVWLLYFSLMVSYCCHHLFPTFWNEIWRTDRILPNGRKWTGRCLSRWEKGGWCPPVFSVRVTETWDGLWTAAVTTRKQHSRTSWQA